MNEDVKWALEVVTLVAGTVVVFYGFYRLVHKFFPGWGTIITNGVAGATILLEALQGVPWHYVLSPKQVSYATFGLFIVNMLMRMTKTSKETPQVGNTKIEIK